MTTLSDILTTKNILTISSNELEGWTVQKEEEKRILATQ